MHRCSGLERLGYLSGGRVSVCHGFAQLTAGWVLANVSKEVQESWQPQKGCHHAEQRAPRSEARCHLEKEPVFEVGARESTEKLMWG